MVGGMIKFPFAMYNEKHQKGANIPRAHRVENKLEESTGGKRAITKTITLNQRVIALPGSCTQGCGEAEQLAARLNGILGEHS